jgi:hypothetical protein
MRAIMLAALVAVLPASASSADLPEWQAVRTCFDHTLAELLPARETAESLFRAARATCRPQLDAAMVAMAASVQPTPSAVDMAVVGKQIDDGLFAYVVRFKAAGGIPPTP